mgnify:CR=1 FL=1
METILRLATHIYRLTFVVGLLSLLLAEFVLPDFLKYGKTLTEKGRKTKSNISSPILYNIVHFTVPKAWFSHFYILSTGLSIITCLSFPRYVLPWLILLHSLRRLYETLYVNKYTSKSRMNWTHYAVGIWFYSVLHIIMLIKLYENKLEKTLNVPAFVVMAIASWDQYMNHKVLSKLVKYSLPKQRLFTVVSSPHYMDELLIYASYVPYNWEFIWLVVWIFASLSVSALETQKYYKRVFTKEKIPPYAIIPYLL